MVTALGKKLFLSLFVLAYMYICIGRVLKYSRRYGEGDDGIERSPGGADPGPNANMEELILTRCSLSGHQGECHPDTCTQMTATEQWIFLCAAHKTPKEVPLSALKRPPPPLD